MTHDPASVTLRDRHAAQRPAGGAVTLPATGRRQGAEDVTLVARGWPGPAPSDAVLLVMATPGAALEPPPDYAPTSRPLTSAYRVAYGEADHRRRAVTRARWAQPARRRTGRRVAYRHSPALLDAQSRLPWAQNQRLRNQPRVRWPGDAEPMPGTLRAPWGALDRMRGAVRAPYRDAGERLAIALRLPYINPPSRRHATRAPYREARDHIAPTLRLPYLHPPTKRGGWRLPWGTLPGALRWGTHPPPPPEPEPEPEPPPTFDAQPGDNVLLDLHRALVQPPGDRVGLDLPGGAFDTDPPPGVIVHNSVTVQRSDTDEPVSASTLRMTADLFSWAWTFDATLLGPDAYALVQHGSSGPPPLRVAINGVNFELLAEEHTETRRWQANARTVSGRSHAAVLAAPYAPPESGEQATDRTAQQLAGDALEFTGWTLQWEVPDWLIPGGVYSYRNKTPIDRINDVAAAIGATVLTHPSDQVVIVRSPYPVSPWDWATATPDVVIEARHIAAQSSRWQPAPEYNRVHVMGREQGVLVQVTRDGTAGDLPAEEVVHPLITHVDAGRERGRVLLAAAGDSATVTLDVPFDTGAGGYGLIERGLLVEVNDGADTWRGVSTGVTLSAGRESVRQEVQIERRFTP